MSNKPATSDQTRRTPAITTEQWEESTREAVETMEAGLGAVAKVADMQHGDVNPLAARHLDPTRETTDERGETYAAPDYYVASVAQIKTSRSNSGRTLQRVTRRGHTFVMGDDIPTDRSSRYRRAYDCHTWQQIVGRWAMLDSIRSARRYRHGMADGEQITRIASAAYGLPDLLGGESWSWSEATCEIPTDAHDIAQLADHRVGLTGGIHPLADRAVMPEHAHGDDHERVSYPHTFAVPRPVKRRSARLSLSKPRKRDADADTGAVQRVADNGALELLAPCADGARDTHLWRGFTRVRRGETQRVQRTARKRGVDGSFVIPRGESVPDHLAGIAATVPDDDRGYRYAWRRYGSRMTGTLTVTSPDGRGRRRYSVTMPDGATVRGQRTPRGLARKLSAIA